MEQMVVQEVVDYVYNIILGSQNQTDMFYPEFTRIGYSLRYGLFPAQIWECHVADILP